MKRGVATGQMRHRVEIQTPVQAVDSASGDVSESFPGTVAKRWAAIEQLTGDEAFDAAQVAAGATHKITMRFCKALTERCQLLFGKRVFSIKSIWIPEEVPKEWQVVYVSE